MQRIQGVISADLNFASATLLVEHDPAVDVAEKVVAAVESSGHGIQSLDDIAAGEPVPERPWLDRNRAEVATVGSGVFSLFGFALGFARRT